MKNDLIILTPGDPSGIGPEITWKAICHFHQIKSEIRILCVGALQPFEALRIPFRTLNFGETPTPVSEPVVWILPSPQPDPKEKVLLEGYQVGWAIKKATELVLQGFGSALVTGPISKERLIAGGYVYHGHTEFLAEVCQVPSVTMMLANRDLRVSLVTTHLALKDVAKALTRNKIEKTVLQTVEGLRKLWKIAHPRIAVLGLNPHAGEAGIFGTEEIDLIIPTLTSLKTAHSKSFEIEGPFPADTFFALQRHSNFPYDAVICMYHDQGLIPVKLLDFYKTVNITLGLPIIRTSVDHGVAFDIAGKGTADPSSLIAAVELATQFVQT